MSEKRNAGLAVPTALLVALAVPVAATLPGCGGEGRGDGEHETGSRA